MAYWNTQGLLRIGESSCCPLELPMESKDPSVESITGHTNWMCSIGATSQETKWEHDCSTSAGAEL